MLEKQNQKNPFIPPPLPPKGVDYGVLFKDIVITREAVARFDESLKRLPNPEIIQHTFETKEAVLSSRIEGTQVTLDEVLVFDAEEEEDQETEKEKDYREVANYRKAIMLGKELLEEKPLGENVIKELHAILLDSVRGSSRNPGSFRKKQVAIGPSGGSIEDARFIPPPPQDIIELFSNLEKYLHSEDVPDPIIQIAIGHYQFEAIHPFSDGNGRVGRILIPLFLYARGVTTYPGIFMSEFLEKNRDEYYDLLLEVSEKENWISWIKFFALGLRKQVEITGKRVARVEELYESLLSRIPEFNSIYTHAFIDAIFKRPVFSARQLGKSAEIKNNQTLYNLIEKFLQADVISDMTPQKERNKIYAFQDLLRVIR